MKRFSTSLVIFLFAVSCQKISESTQMSVLNDSLIVSKINNYLIFEAQKFAGIKKERVLQLLQSIEIQSLHYYLDENELCVTFDIIQYKGDLFSKQSSLPGTTFFPKKIYDYDKKVGNKKYKYKKLIASFKNGEVKNINTIELSTDFKKEDIEKDLQKIINGKKDNFSGYVKFKDLTGKALIEFGLANGKVSSYSIYTKSGKSVNSSTSNDLKLYSNFDSPKKSNSYECTAWYRVTTYYYSDGTTSEEWDYLYTSCTCVPDDAQISVTHANCEEGSGDDRGTANIVNIQTESLCDLVKDFLLLNGYSTHMTALKEGMSLSNEKLSYSKKNPSNMDELYMIQGTGGCAGGIDLLGHLSAGEKISSAIHNHLSGCGHEAVFTLDDLKLLAYMFKNNKMENVNNFIYGVMTPQGVFSLLKINDITKFGTFADILLNDLSYSLLVSAFNSLGFKNNNTADAHENAFVKYLASLNSGLTLFSGNQDNFTTWKVKERDSDLNIQVIGCDQ